MGVKSKFVTISLNDYPKDVSDEIMRLIKTKLQPNVPGVYRSRRPFALLSYTQVIQTYLNIVCSVKELNKSESIALKCYSLYTYCNETLDKLSLRLTMTRRNIHYHKDQALDQYGLYPNLTLVMDVLKKELDLLLLNQKDND